jgi:hypothetical protein
VMAERRMTAADMRKIFSFMFTSYFIASARCEAISCLIGVSI